MAGTSTYVFIDGGHIRSGLERIHAPWHELDLGSMSQVLPTWVGGSWKAESMIVNRVFVYDAVPEEETEGDVGTWLEHNDRQMDVEVRYGRLTASRRSGREQKGVDVQLAVDALSFAGNGVYDVAILVTGDADFVPVVKAVRERGPLVCVCSFKDALADELSRCADRVGYLLEDPGAYAAWQLPPASVEA